MASLKSTGHVSRDWRDLLAMQAADLPRELSAYAELCRGLGERAATPAGSVLMDEALEVVSRPGFDTFVCLPRLRFEPFGFQLKAAERALRDMRGRGILADEVGLGKTIEAALVLSELRLRGLANHVLVLAPVGLIEQWQQELERKFALPSLVASGSSWEPKPGSIVLASLQAARRDPLRRQLVGRAWDVVIVDEAHRLKNPRSASARLARDLQTRYLLLLTATPVENRLDDLFQLVSLVRPGYLGTAGQFRARYGGDAGGVVNVAELQARLRQVMVRHRRSELGVLLPGRLAQTLAVTPDAQEADLYRRVAQRVREEGRGATRQGTLALSAALRLAGSSPRALVPSLAKLGWQDLAGRAAGIERSEKGRMLLEVLSRHGARGEKVVVFTGFLQTLEFLVHTLRAAGIPAAVYHGGLRRQEKEGAIAAFRDGAPVMLTTEAAGEGRNLQFCHVMVNFDLPWNPMQIEQRLGRIHRIGQDHEVQLYNLVGRGTIEEQVLAVLESKINLFELVVGELDMILGRVHEDLDFPTLVYDTHVASADEEEFRARLEALGRDLAEARRAYLQSRERTDALAEGEGAA